MKKELTETWLKDGQVLINGTISNESETRRYQYAQLLSFLRVCLTTNNYYAYSETENTVINDEFTGEVNIAVVHPGITEFPEESKYFPIISARISVKDLLANNTVWHVYDNLKEFEFESSNVVVYDNTSREAEYPEDINDLLKSMIVTEYDSMTENFNDKSIENFDYIDIIFSL